MHITPGMPKNPAIRDVHILIPITKLKYPPTKFTNHKRTAPKKELIIIFIIHFKGITKNFPKIKIKHIHIKKVNTFIFYEISFHNFI